MTSATASGSVCEATSGKTVRDLAKEWLVVWSPATSRIETDTPGVEIDFGANETMRPPRIDVKRFTQHRDRAVVGRAAQKDHGATWRGLQIELPRRGTWVPARRVLQALAAPLPAGCHIPVRPFAKGCVGGVVKAAPHLGLPASVEILQGCLKRGLIDRRICAI